MPQKRSSRAASPARLHRKSDLFVNDLSHVLAARARSMMYVSRRPQSPRPPRPLRTRRQEVATPGLRPIGGWIVWVPDLGLAFRVRCAHSAQSDQLLLTRRNHAVKPIAYITDTPSVVRGGDAAEGGGRHRTAMSKQLPKDERATRPYSRDAVT
eukprot:2808581-Prymnesium_polylepis.1